jgi:hypothetical protein
MQNPSLVVDSEGEWFELINSTSYPLDLAGLVITNELNQDIIIDTPTYLDSGQLYLVGASEDAESNGGVSVDLAWHEGTFSLNNEEGLLSVSSAGGVMTDIVSWSSATFPVQHGASMSLNLTQFDGLENDNPENWCTSSTPFGSGDLGSPGSANELCPDPLCEEITCDNPPLDDCIDNDAYTYAPIGNCSLGLCEYELIQRDCTSMGLFCAGGQCNDLCDLLSCDEPPLSSCEDDIATTWNGISNCSEGSCNYGFDFEDCSSSELFCFHGLCQALDPCDGIICELPPPQYCDGDLIVSYVREGECFNGMCEYDTTLFDCTSLAQFCNAGYCQALNPCAEIGCPSPSNSCDGDVAVVYDGAPGVCIEGSCDYDEPVRINCADFGHSCLDGECRAVGPCTNVICDTPPASFCSTDEPSVHYTSPGECVEGLCQYESTVDFCSDSETCSDGLCLGNCDLVTCDTPPEPTCDSGMAFTYISPGICAEETGACEYTNTREVCSLEGDFCMAGSCQPEDPCLGVFCTTAPAPFCEDNNSHAYLPVGGCAYGECTYTEVETNCSALDQFCFEGLCQDEDMCLDVSCEGATEASCDDNEVVFYNAGVCSEGICTYSESRTACEPQENCLESTCVNLCEGVECGPAPAPYCDENMAVTASDIVNCSMGECVYGTTYQDCGSMYYLCLDGECLPDDPCRDIVCSVPPSPYCDELMAVQWEAIGLCDDGDCNYTPIYEDCAESGGFCTDGVCESEDPCADLICDEAPLDFCEGNTTVIFDAPGTCLSGICDFTFTRSDCTEADLICSAARCVGPINPGTLVITEVMQNPASVGNNSGEWFEIFNTSSDEVDLFGIIFRDDNIDHFVVSDNMLVPGHSYFLIGAVGNPSLNGGISLGMVWTTNSMVLNNDSDTIIIELDGEIIDQVSWDDGTSFPDPNGRTMSLDPDTLDSDSNDEGSNWCYGTSVYGAGDAGTPGSENTDCPIGSCAELTCDSPISAYCDGDMVLSFSGLGNCTDGSCSYDAEFINCVESGGFCVDGACTPNDPCGPDICSAFTPYCEGDEMVLSDGDGACDMGVCTYSENRLNCTALGLICTEGSCLDSCSLVTCNTPPAPYCLDASAYVFESDGVCEDGICTYIETTTNCAAGPSGGFCLDGSCQSNDPCDEVVCDLPTQPSCDENLATTYSGPGFCSSGLCTYSEETVDCAASGLVCLDGTCVTNCDVTVCDSPPSAYCNENTAMKYNPVGTCFGEGNCSYSEILFDCDSLELSCSLGVCVDLPQSGDLIITEIMRNPGEVADLLGEWFEIHNTGDNPIDLNGLILRDDGGFELYVISGSYIVDQNGFFVLGNNADFTTNGGVTLDYTWGEGALSLGNGNDAIQLFWDELLLDKVSWDNDGPFPNEGGASMSLDPDSIDTDLNNDGSNWCAASSAYGDGDLGTPGAENDPCGVGE